MEFPNRPEYILVEKASSGSDLIDRMLPGDPGMNRGDLGPFIVITISCLNTVYCQWKKIASCTSRPFPPTSIFCISIHTHQS